MRGIYNNLESPMSQRCPSLHRPFTRETGYSRAPPASHNLNVSAYSFDELLQMFGLTYQMTLADLTVAKRKVLMVHPDKSGLPSDYFLFYKRAFEHIVQYYTQQTRQTQVVDETTSTIYIPLQDSEESRFGSEKIRQTVDRMTPEQFQRRFNELFDQNMAQKPDETRNDWFRRDDGAPPEFAVEGKVHVGNLGATFETIKAKQRESGMILYTGVRELSSSVGGQYYPDAEDEETGPAYVSSDPFSKLRYDDLRKVHKDQTVFSVSESDYDRVPKYKNIEQYSRVRGEETLTPLEKAEAERIFAQREQEATERAARRQHQAEIQSQTYAEKSRNVMGAFLQIEHDGGRRFR